MRHFPAAGAALALCSLLFSGACSKDEPDPVRTYNVGEKAQAGHLIYTAFETQWSPTLGEGQNARAAERRFFLVRMSIVNSGSKDTLVPNIALIGDDGQTHTELSNGEGVPHWMGFLRHVGPADTLQGYVVFDVAPAHYKMRVTDETEQKTALIDIPLNFTGGPSELPLPAPPPEAPKK